MAIGIDSESAMFQIDWEPLEDWMRRRAEEKGLRGWEIYSHSEELVLDYVIDQTVVACAFELGWAAGNSMADLEAKFYEQEEHRRESEAAERES